MLVLLATGMAIGLAMAVPVGPVNLFVISRTLKGGFRAGFAAGLGGMAADTLLAVVAAFGITTVIDFVDVNEKPIQFVGGILLVLFGILSWRSHPHLDPEAAVARPGHRVGGFVQAVVMTLTNPGASLGMLAIFGSLGDLADFSNDHAAAVAVVGGVAIGSTLWWLLLAGSVKRIKARLTDDWLHRVNQFAGAVLIVAGFGLLFGLIVGVTLL